MTTPPGWYDDGAGSRRWWDGVQWTAHVVTAPATTAAASATEPAVVDAAPEEASTAAEEASPTAEPEPEPFAPPYLAPSAAPIAPASMPQAGVAWASAPASAYGAPWAAPAPVPAPAPGVSVLGVVGLAAVVVGVVCVCIPLITIVGWGLLAVGFVVSLVSLFLRGRRWPGITGMVVAVVGAFLALAVSLVVGMVSAAAEDRGLLSGSDERPPTDSSAIEGAEMVPFAELEVGDCIPLFDYGDEEEISEVPVVPCDLPHTDEVYFIFDLEDGEFPGADVVEEAAWDRCLTEFERFVGVSYEDSALDFYPYWPTEGSWIGADDRTVQCVAVSYDDVTGTLRDAGY
jgi:hypothetical protein